MSHVFISYSRKNQEYARRLAEDIRKHGFDVWIDDRIDSGERWWATIVNAIEVCSAFVVIMSPYSEGSEWVEREVLLAQRENKPIIPLLFDGKGFALLITTQCVDVSDGNLPQADFYTRLEAIVKPAQQTGKVVTGTHISFKHGKLELSEQHVKAMVRILEELWYFINRERLEQIYSDLNHRMLNSNKMNLIRDYLLLRESRRDKHFLDNLVEEAFEKFDQKLKAFYIEIGRGHSSVIRENAWWTDENNMVLLPDYKLEQMGFIPYISDEIRVKREKHFDYMLDLGLAMLDQHDALVDVIRLRFPEFTFPSKSSV